MQTILGANGIIAKELAKELKLHFTSDIRLVSRNPQKVNDTDQIVSSDLLDQKQTDKAVKDSEIVYFTVGLPINSALWKEQFPRMIQNVIAACKRYQAKLVLFDNTYMYPVQKEPLTEKTPFRPVGQKAKARAAMASLVLDAIASQQLEAVICRAPEFYGTYQTPSFTNSLIINRILNGQTAKVLISDKTLRTLIWAPDAGKATALIGNTPKAYQQTWHLPCDDNRLTAQEFIELFEKLHHKSLDYNILTKEELTLQSTEKPQIKELLELLPRYRYDYLFDSSKFKQAFPDFTTTTYEEGIRQIITDATNNQ
ncbi:MAG TPA: NAD-dependent epimerase/dehydratase family protein [Paludibacteraceae bacterium]|nr:NAD-dependent epimerase/dehydratase family protein [Paludibacteraceae bacterium]HQB68896.1 NAD-dependent epimerase/dehydratase family protein [Paludibacteraceae bacterium]HRS67922.1 NAD-dependent epimerase/dehydratase family protein [Paludibacteraceae bacterium]